MPEKKRPTFFSVPLNGSPSSMETDETRKTLEALRSIYDKGGPTKPVVSGSRQGTISANTGTRRLKNILPSSDSPLSQGNVIDAIFGSGALESIGSLENIEKGPASIAGLPFAAYKSKGIERLFHGTPELRKIAEEGFDPRKYNVNDVLGHMTHAAEPSELENSGAAYANIYAGKWGFPILADSPGGVFKAPREAPFNPGVIPLKPEAKNVLDLIEPNVDDIAQAVAQIKDPRRKREIIRLFKNMRGKPGAARNEISYNHLGQIDPESLKKQPATHVLADKLRLTPEEIETMPHDAIRYFDTKHKSWAFPSRTPLKSQFEAPLNTAAKVEESPIKMFEMPLDVPVKAKNLPVRASDYKPKSSKQLNEEYAKNSLYSSSYGPINPNNLLPYLPPTKELKTANDFLDWAAQNPNTELNVMNVKELMSEYEKFKKHNIAKFQQAEKKFPEEWEAALAKSGDPDIVDLNMTDKEVDDIMKTYGVDYGKKGDVPVKTKYNEFADKNLIGNKYKVTSPEGNLFDVEIKNKSDIEHFLSFKEKGYKFDKIGTGSGWTAGLSKLSIYDKPEINLNKPITGKWTEEQMDMILDGLDTKEQAYNHIHDLYSNKIISQKEMSDLLSHIGAKK